MKRTYIAAAAVVSFCLIVTAVTRNAAGSASSACEQEDVFDFSQSVSETAARQEKSYLLTELDGKIAVYETGIVNPIKVTDTYVCNLPEYDREKIKIGIKIYGDTALRKALEDYCS